MTNDLVKAKLEELEGDLMSIIDARAGGKKNKNISIRHHYIYLFTSVEIPISLIDMLNTIIRYVLTS